MLKITTPIKRCAHYTFPFKWTQWRRDRWRQRRGFAYWFFHVLLPSGVSAIISVIVEWRPSRRCFISSSKTRQSVLFTHIFDVFVALASFFYIALGRELERDICWETRDMFSFPFVFLSCIIHCSCRRSRVTPGNARTGASEVHRGGYVLDHCSSPCGCYRRPRRNIFPVRGSISFHCYMIHCHTSISMEVSWDLLLWRGCFGCIVVWICSANASRTHPKLCFYRASLIVLSAG